MSDAIDALNKIVYKAAEREEDCGANETLLEEISVIAGDSLEDHVAARDKAKPRKERVFKEIVEQVSNLVKECDMTDPEGTYYTLELIQELLDRYEVPA